MAVTHRRRRADTRRRLPDEVRTAAVRTVLFFAFTLVCAMVTVLASLARSWLIVPALMVTAVGVFASAWCLLEIGIARQVAAERTRGSSTATAWPTAAGVGRSPHRRPASRTPAVGSVRRPA